MKKLIIAGLLIASQGALADEVASTLTVNYTKPDIRVTEYTIKTAAFLVNNKEVCKINNATVTENQAEKVFDCGEHQAGIRVERKRYQNIGVDWTVTDIHFSIDLPNEKLTKEYELSNFQRFPKDY